MEDLKFEYYSRRSIAARFGVHISDVAVSMMKWSTWLLILLGTVIVFVAGWSMGWAVMGVAVIPFMISQYVAHYVRDLPPKMTVAATDRIEGSVLGHLPARPTPADVASAVGRASSGQFMGARLGMSPSLL